MSPSFRGFFGRARALGHSDQDAMRRQATTVDASCLDCGGEGDVAHWVEAAGDYAVSTCGRCTGQGTVPAPFAA